MLWCGGVLGETMGFGCAEHIDGLSTSMCKVVNKLKC